jgi:EAL domain-containing protein (putative c-di-GMP-specific phosphodiesterase class I)/DNA-binding response OmpR family regulator
MEPTVTILIADDDESVRNALTDFFTSDPRFEVVAVAVDATTAAALAAETHPDVALLDVRMPGGGGPAAAHAIREGSPSTRVVALSAYEDRATVLEMVDQGAIAYVVKGHNPNTILEAALKAASGVATLSPEVARGVIDEAAAHLQVTREQRRQRRSRHEGEEALRAALTGEQFRVVYQPKVSLQTGRIAGVEALLRWDHPERGTIPPLEFIPLAEESGLITTIGEWVLARVCRDAQAWTHALPGDRPLSVAVNVSPRQFEPGLAESFGEIITSSGVDISSICLELTEGTVMQDPELTIKTLRKLKELGLRISIDDFGTGFSSLAYLKRYPLDELKVDKTFVDGLGANHEDTAIVAAVMGMAHALDLHVVGEGVETERQAEQLRVLGCDEVQGYFYGRPGSAADITDLLHAEAENGPVHAHLPGVRSRVHRILVVDDAADVRNLARSSLSASGFEVREAATGEEAITSTRHFAPDCVVLDVNLPGISGLDVCRVLRDDPDNAHITIVMLTVHAEAMEKVEAFSLDADDYMVKPFTPRDLVSRVNAAIQRRAAQRGAPRAPNPTP